MGTFNLFFWLFYLFTPTIANYGQSSHFVVIFSRKKSTFSWYKIVIAFLVYPKVDYRYMLLKYNYWINRLNINKNNEKFYEQFLVSKIVVSSFWGITRYYRDPKKKKRTKVVQNLTHIGNFIWITDDSHMILTYNANFTRY